MHKTTRLASNHTIIAALQRWSIRAFHALNLFPVLPGSLCPWDGSGTYTAIIRGSGFKHSAKAALAYTDTHGETHVEIFHKDHVGETIYRSTTSARIDALEHLLHNTGSARAISLFIDDPVLRGEIAAMIDSFPTLELTTTPLNALSLAANQAISQASTTIKNTVVTMPQPQTQQCVDGSPLLTIASDASIIPGELGAGIATVASNGAVWQGRLPDTGDIDWAEMKAIHAAIAGSLTHPHVRVLSDSKKAIAFANGTIIPEQRRMRNLAAQIHTLRTGRDVTITWVRGHHGHPLNEAADALARQARHLHITTTAT